MQKLLLRILTLSLVYAGPGLAQTWVQKISGSGLGNSLRVNPLNSNVLYGSPGTRFVYVSHDRGYTWQQYGNPVPAFGPSPNAIKSIAVNPKDTLQMLVGVESSSGDVDRIMKTTNGGATWTLTWGGSFYYYGKPVEFKPEHPDTVYTMGNDTLWRSIDFGSTWDTVTVRRGADFNAWCDAELRPDSANIMFLGDAGTGIWKTTDHGVTWRQVYTAIASGEIPAVAIDPFNYQTMYGTRFSGGGGVIKSTDGGETWTAITTPIGISSSWWITCSAVHPNYVYFGVYFTGSTAGVYISRDAGASWENLDAGFSSTAKFNYGLLALDSLTVIAGQQNLQSDLAAHPNQCLLAYWHIPLFSSYPNAAPNSQPFWNLLYSAHADLILNGHSHTYERFGQQNPSGGADPNGIRQIIVGTGGKSHYSITSTAANSEVQNTSTYGVLKLSLHSNSYDWQFISVDGSYSDSGTGKCH